MKKRIISMLLALIMAVSLLPMSALAADEHANQVHVTVENTTWTKADGAPWEGMLVDEWVTLQADSSMMSCIKAALDKKNIPSTINASSYGGEYISAINGLGEFSTGSESGWMGTLNDWFTNLSFSAFTVSDGTLGAGDEIRIMYTKTGYGKDIGSDWSTQSNTALSALSFSSGTLSPAFDKATTAYTLTLTAPASVKVSATAANKCNQVYLSVGETNYRRTASIPLESGTVLTVRCGDAAEAGGGAPAVTPTVYTVTVKVDAPQTPPARREGVAATAAESVSVNKPYTLDLSTIFVDANGDPLTYFVSVNGGAYAKADANYSYTPTAAGTTTLTFKANDGHADSTDAYTVTLTAIDKVNVTFKGVSLAASSQKLLMKFEVYAYQDGQIGTTVLETIEENGATVKLSPGNYWIRAYDSKDDCCGGIGATVPAEESAEIKIWVAYGIKATNAGWVSGENGDYTTSVTVKDENGNLCKVEMGNLTGVMKFGTKVKETNQGPSCLVLNGYTLEATFTPTEKRAEEGYVATSAVHLKGKPINQSTAFPKTAIPMGKVLQVSAPKGSTISAGTLQQSYYYNFAKSTVVDSETGVTASFKGIPEDATVFIRVQHPDGVTYWDFFNNLTADKSMEVKAEDLHIGDDSFNKDTVYRFDKNIFDRGDIYMNINAQGYKSMTVGETYSLNMFRNWQAIESFMNGYIALPDMHYQVLDVNGQPSDVVRITPDANNSSAATMTANKAGTAIVLVTYDAMTHKQGQSSTASKEFTAIWPECTGVFVVTVDADGTGIQTNMFMDRMDSKLTAESDKNIDAEHDILFYLGDDGATYSFKPEEGCTVSVARSTVTDKMTFSGFTTDGVSVAADGTVTLSGLTTGRHIVKVEKGGVATYQVITARQVTLTLLDKDGNKLPADTEFKPGDQVTLQFSGLLNPQEKLATAYNFNFKLHIKGSDGTYFDSDPGSEYGVYDFSSNPERQRITITIPEDWAGAAYQLTGALSKGGFAGGVTHRELTYGTGRAPVQDAPTASGILARLPAVTLRVQTTGLDEIYKTTGDFIAGLGTPSVGSTGGEWMTIGLARSGRTVPAGYYENVVEYVKEHADANERLHRAKVTDNARVILALTAIGKDVTNVGGHNLLKGMDNMDFVQKQGINGPIWTLIALDSHNYPTSGDVTREKLIGVILDAQLTDGGWALSGEIADPDMTGMALQALAPYYKTNETVKAAVDKALETLSAMQRSNGGFASWGTENSESCAQVIVALTALGIDPTADSRFVKNGLTALDALASFYVTGGGFKHVSDKDRDGMATEQGYYALAAYYRFANGQTGLYDMSDVTIQTGSNGSGGTPATGDNGVTMWVVALPVAALGAALVLTKKKREG